MEENRVTSLCISAIRPGADGDKPFFFRLADFDNDGNLIPFKRDTALVYDGYNFDRFRVNAFSKYIKFPAVGTPVFIEWSSYFDDEVQKFHQEADVIDTRYNVIEYIRIDGVGSMEQLKSALTSNINFDFVENQEYLVEVCKMGENEYYCVYCKGSDFSRKSSGVQTLDSRIYELNTFTIKASEIVDAPAYLTHGIARRYYMLLGLPQQTGTILVRIPADLVKDVVVKRINKCAEGLDKTKKQVLREFLRNHDSDSILESIVAELRCPTEKAKEFFNDFVAHCEDYLSDEDFLQGVLIDIIGKENDVAQKYRCGLKDEFEREFEEQKQKLSAELSILSGEHEATQKLLVDRLAEKSSLENDITALQGEYSAKLLLASEVDEQIRSKISAAKSNLAGFLSEYAVFATPGAAHQSFGTSSCSYSEGHRVSEDCESIRSKEVLEYLSDNLKVIGIDSQKADILSAYLLAAYISNVPLILAGYRASAVADALSATLFNRTADRMNIDGRVPPNATGSGKVVAIYDAFGCMDKVLEATRGKYSCFIAQTSEELAIEPRSLFNYALPLHLEYFVKEDAEADKLAGSVLEGEISAGKIVEKAKTLIPPYCLPSLAQTRAKKLISLAQDLRGRSCDIRDIFELQVIPIMLSLSLREQLTELFSRKHSTRAMLRLIGEPNEQGAD